MVGDAEHRIRVYLALKNQKPSPLMEVPIGRPPRPRSRSSSPRASTTSRSRSWARQRIRDVGDGALRPRQRQAEGDDHVAEGQRASSTARASTIKGKVQARSTLLARNETNGATIAGRPRTRREFTLSIPITTGKNTINIDATDPAGNASTTR